MPFLNQTLKRVAYGEPRLRRARPLLGTYVEITLHGNAPMSLLRHCMSAGFEAMTKIHDLMSFHNSDSDLSRLNRAAPDKWVLLHPKTIDVLKAAQQLHRLSGGVFDIRCGAALTKKRIPLFKSKSALEFRGTRVRKTGSWTLDLGGIAKGYAVDCAVETIQRLARDQKISGIVNAGGDLRTWGRAIPITTRISGQDHPWTRSFSVQHTALATSSPAAHIRMPAQRLTRRTDTATVFAKHCVVADALTKIVLLAPAAVTKQCLHTHNARALVFRSDGTLRRTITA